MTEAPSPFSAHNPKLRIAWDATSLRPMLECPRKGLYKTIENWDFLDHTHVDFGAHYHSALEAFDIAVIEGLPHDQAVDIALQTVLDISETFDETKNPKITQKTRRTLARSVVWYADSFGSNPAIQPYVFPDGTPAVELSFAIPMGIKNRYGEDYLLCGHMDGIVDFCGRKWIRERKTTSKTLSKYYFQQFEPDIQISTYDFVGAVLFPELEIAGVMLEATQVGVTFSRFANHEIRRDETMRQEYISDVRYYVLKAEEFAEAGYWPKNEATCGLYGGCDFQEICKKPPLNRDAFLRGNFDKREWNPLALRTEAPNGK